MIAAPQQPRSERTLRKILQACDVLLADRPFEQISMQDIAREAGVSVGNMYNRFADKDALIAYVIARHQQDFREHMDRCLAEHPPGLALHERLSILAASIEEGLRRLRPVFTTLVARAGRGVPLNADAQEGSDDITEAAADWLLLSETEIRGAKRQRCRFAVSSLAFGLQFDLLLGTATRLFGENYLHEATEQAYHYLIHEEKSK